LINSSQLDRIFSIKNNIKDVIGWK
jgi:hypothetical protein